VEMPISPMPPARASGEILKKGTAVVTIFILSASWARAFTDIPTSSRPARHILLNECVIRNCILLKMNNEVVFFSIFKLVYVVNKYRLQSKYVFLILRRF
jgi:hypothetical protein